MKRYLYTTLVLLITFGSCQTVVDADKLLDTEEKVHIVGFLSPSDTVLRVNVSKALPSIGTPLPANDYEAFREAFLIKNAQVQIRDGFGNQTSLVYVDTLETYLADAATLSIESEQEYFLEVTVDDKTYSASCRIPLEVGEIDHEISTRISAFDETIGVIKFRFQDFADEKNFYMLGGLYKVNFTYEDQEPTDAIGSLYFDTDQFLTDNISNGGTIGGNGEFYIGSGVEINNASVTLQVAHMEEIIFQQMRTDDLNFDAEGNPFVEYAIAPNNFLDEGAVGVFAGYTITEKEIELDF
ncbi:MAG: DUF4249 family protein [Maribacter sp.]